MNCGYRFLVCLFRFLLLIGELLIPFRHARTFMMAAIFKNIVPRFSVQGRYLRINTGNMSNLLSCISNASVKVLNRIFAVLVKANPSRENNYNYIYFNVKAFYHA